MIIEKNFFFYHCRKGNAEVIFEIFKNKNEDEDEEAS